MIAFGARQESAGDARTRVQRLIFLCWCVAGLALFVLLAGCSGKDGDWVARAEAANHEADRLLAAGNADGARDVLQGAEASMAKAVTPDARVVRLDLLYRLATIELAKSNAKGAVDWATRGLDLGRTNDAFTTNLLIVRGRALEQMGNAIAASRDYHDALVITEALLDKTLEAPPP